MLILSLLTQTINMPIIQAEISDKSITYNEEINAFQFQNVTLNELIISMEEAGYHETYSESKNNATKIFVEDNKGINVELNATTKYYQLSDTIKGVLGENVNVYFNIVMNIKYVTYNGTKYVQLVSFNNGSNSLDSGIYEFASGLGVMNVSILNGGSTLAVNQLVQLQTTVAISSSQTVGSDWYQYSQGTTSNYYYRSSVKQLSSKMNLPLYSIVA